MNPRFHLLFLLLLSLFFIRPERSSAYHTGIIGRTLKTTRTGCSCHGTSATPGVQVSISGPDTIVRNSSATYTVTISGGPAIGAGVDIAARYGVLAPISPTLKDSSHELAHRNIVMMTGGSVTFQFTLTDSGTTSFDTLYATGLSANNAGGNTGDQWNWAINKPVIVQSTTEGVEAPSVALPHEARLFQNYPNLFNPTTDVRYAICDVSPVTLKVYDVLGREVATLVNEAKEPGEYTVTWDAGNEPSGIYFFRLTAGTFTETKKLMLVK